MLIYQKYERKIFKEYLKILCIVVSLAYQLNA